VGDGQTPGGQTSTFRLLHAGQHVTEYWNAYPLHPGTNVSFPGTRATFVGYPVHPSAARAGNTLSLHLTPFSDNQPAHLGDGFDVPYPGKASQVSGRYTLYQNGTKIAAGNAATATGDVQVSATLSTRPSLATFVLTASRASPQYQLSATSRDVWTWHSRPQPGATVPAPWACNFAGPPDRHCAVQPMITLNYTVAGLSLYGTTWPGHQAIAQPPRPHPPGPKGRNPPARGAGVVGGRQDRAPRQGHGPPRQLHGDIPRPRRCERVVAHQRLRCRRQLDHRNDPRRL